MLLRTDAAATLALLLLALVPALVVSMSDTYGHNPQHEFGTVVGKSLSSLIPFWRLEGDAFANQEFVRLVPDRQSKKGAMWNSEINHFQQWEITFKFRIHGVSSIGADGMAFWYTKEAGIMEGNFFGFTPTFTGLGIVLDTYDNDNSGMHPVLVAIVNDGTKKYEHSHHHHSSGEGAGGENEVKMEIGNCPLPTLRNRDTPSLVRVTYVGRQLTVETQLGGHSDFAKCLVANNIELPTGYHFGFSAATGQLADNHDLYGFSLRNLDSNAASIDSQRTFSTFDKYLVADYLSKIHYEVSKSQPSTSAATSGPAAFVAAAATKTGGAATEAAAGPKRLDDSLTKIDASLRLLSDAFDRLERKIEAGGGGAAARSSRADSHVSTELVHIKATLAGIAEKLNDFTPSPPSQATNKPMPLKPRRDSYAAAGEGWGMTFWVFAGALVLVVAVAVGYTIKSRNDRAKKFF